MNNARKENHLYHEMINNPIVYSYIHRNDEAAAKIMVSDSTRVKYRQWLKLAAKFFVSIGICYLSEISIALIQIYVNYLVESEKSASTIHNYISVVCKVQGISMSQIIKPIRYAAEFTRGSSSKVIYGGAPSELNQYLGLRPYKELANLRGDDLIYDEVTANYYVRVKRGKNGKKQYQKVIPEFVEYVKAFFDGTHKKLFKKADFVKGYPYHNDRRNLAIALYPYYEEKIAEDPEFAKQLYKQIAHAWHQLNKKHRNDLEPLSYFLEHPYRLRGKNKELAIAQGKPVVLNRLILRAISVLHLSHWRDGVTVQSYFFDR